MNFQWFWSFAFILPFWVGVTAVIARLAGWARLADRFRADRIPHDGKRFSGQFMTVGWWDYNGCVIFLVAETGLFVSVWPILFGHPPLLIPWNQIRILEERSGRFFPRALIEFTELPRPRLWLPLRTAFVHCGDLEVPVSVYKGKELIRFVSKCGKFALGKRGSALLMFLAPRLGLLVPLMGFGEIVLVGIAESQKI